MCGRLACTLAPRNIIRACTYKDKEGKEHKPKWVDASDGENYYPSSNIPPTSHTPVMYSNNPDEERNIQPMMWGLVPYWHHDSDPKSHGLSTHNARIEGIEHSKLYSRYLEQRCVIVCDGFYEWQRSGDRKQPYLVYAGQKKKHEIEEVLDYSQDPDSDINEGEWKGPKLLYMAGLYSVWQDPEGTPVHSYSVITRDSGPVLSWMHNRVPCILTSEAMVNKWLDPDLTVDGALRMLKAPKEKDLEWHPVSQEVGNVKNQDLDLLKEAEPLPKEDKKKGTASKATKSLMSNWLKKSPSVNKTTNSNGSSSHAGVKRDADGSTFNASIKREADGSTSNASIKREADTSNAGPSQATADKDESTEKKIKLDEEDILVKDEDLIHQYKADDAKHEKGEEDVSFKDEDLIWDYIVDSEQENDDEDKE